MIAASSTDGWGTAPFATPESFTLMWEYIRYFLGQYMPFIMIVVSIFIAWGLAAILVNIFADDKQKKDDDDPVDYM